MREFKSGGGFPEVEIKTDLPKWAKELLNGLPVFAKLDPNEDGPPHLNPDWIIAFYLFGDAVNVEQKFSYALAEIKKNHQNRFDRCSSCMAILEGAREIAGSPDLPPADQLTEGDYERMVVDLKNKLEVDKSSD